MGDVIDSTLMNINGLPIPIPIVIPIPIHQRGLSLTLVDYRLITGSGRKDNRY